MFSTVFLAGSENPLANENVDESECAFIFSAQENQFGPVGEADQQYSSAPLASGCEPFTGDKAPAENINDSMDSNLDIEVTLTENGLDATNMPENDVQGE